MKFTRKKLAIIYNPKGGSAKSAKVAELKRLFEAQGLEVILLTTTPEPGSAMKLAQEAAAMGVEVVVPFGGDGTVCQVAEGLFGTDTVLAVYPGGTGNLFARSFYANPKPKQFVSMVMSGQPQAVDMVRLEYDDLSGVHHVQHQLVALGLGKVSDAISGASPFFKQLFGKLTYVVRVTLACLRPGAQKFEIVTPDAQLNDEASAVFVLNVTPPLMSSLSRGVNASDGLLDVVLIRGVNTWQLIKAAMCLVFGNPELSSHYRRIRTPEVTIKSSVPVTPNIDGDPGSPTKSLKLTSVKAAVRMILSH